MNIKNNKRYKMSSEKLENAFLALILNHPYEEISVSQICSLAGINRSTFYEHYDDINDMIVKIENRFAKNMGTIFNYGMRQEHDAFIEMFTFVKENKYFYKAFLALPYQTFAETEIRSTILANLKDTIDEKKEMELFYRASFFGAGIKEMCKIWLNRDCKESPEEMATLLLNEYSNRTV